MIYIDILYIYENGKSILSMEKETCLTTPLKNVYFSSDEKKEAKRKRMVDLPSVSPSKKYKRQNISDEFPRKNVINKEKDNLQNSKVEKFLTDKKNEEICNSATDDLIKILSEFNASCQKPAKQISTHPLSNQKSVSRVENSKLFSNKKSRYAHKTVDMSVTSKDDLSDNTSNDCDWITDEEIEENTLIIDEPKKKRRPKISEISVPDELMEMIVKSGIDDALEKKAERRKLTATHVKNIIKHIVTDENVCQMMRNTILGIAEEGSTFEPKLTRAKSKELYEKRLKETGDLSSASLLIGTNGDFNGVSASCLPGTSALITTEFPEEEDDEDYHPKLDEQFMSDEESGLSKIGSPCSTPHSSIMGTPSSMLSITPKDFSNSPCTSLINRSSSKSQTKLIKRSLDFTKHTNEFEQIGNRTRSKYPMTDTPIEYLEMQLKAPDATPDLYYMGDDDEEYQNFLSDYVKPHDNNEDAFEDDEQVDPEYNLLQDVKCFNKNAIREEMRGDKGVQVSKKELNQLMDSFLDIFDEDLEDYSQYDHRAKNKDIHELEVNSLFHNTESHPQAINDNYTSQCQISRPLSPQNSWERSITVTYMIPQFSQQHIKVLKSQLAVHVQLLTTTVLNTNHKPFLNFIKLGAVKMLNDMLEEGRLSKPNGHSLFHPDNLQSSIETTTIFEQQKNEESTMALKEVIDDDDFAGYPCRFAHATPHLEQYPDYLKEIYLNSSAFIYPQYLPKGVFHGKLLKRRGAFRASEYWLLACCFKELATDLELIQLKGLVKHAVGCNQDLYYLCRKVAKTGLFYATGRQIAQKMHNLLRNNLYGQLEENPVIKFFQTGRVDLPPAEIIPAYEYYPCCVKDMNTSYLPKSFKLRIEKNIIQKVNNPVLEPFDPSSIKSILVIQDAFGTKIILPPQVLPTHSNEHPPITKETNSDFCFPSYSIPTNKVFNCENDVINISGNLHSNSQNDMLFQAMLDASIMDGFVESSASQKDDISIEKGKNSYIYNHLNSNSPEKSILSGLHLNSTTSSANSDNNEKEKSSSFPCEIDNSDLPVNLCETLFLNTNKNKNIEPLTFSKTLTNVNSNSLNEKVKSLAQLEFASEKCKEFSSRRPKKEKSKCLHQSLKSNLSDKLVESSTFTTKLSSSNIPVKKNIHHCKINCSKSMFDQENVLSLPSLQKEPNHSTNTYESKSLSPNFQETEINQSLLNSSTLNYNSPDRFCSLSTFFDSPDKSMLCSVGSYSKKKNEFANSLIEDPKLSFSPNMIEEDYSLQTDKDRNAKCHLNLAKDVNQAMLDGNCEKQSNKICNKNVNLNISSVGKKKVRDVSRISGKGKINHKQEAGQEPMVLNYIMKVKEILHNGSEGKKQFDLFVSILQQFQRNPSNPKLLFSKIIKLFDYHSDLIDEFTMFLSSSQAKIVGKYIESKTMKDTRAFIKDLESIIKVDKMPQCINLVKQLFSDPQTTEEKVWTSLEHLVKCKKSFGIFVKKHFFDYPKFVSGNQNSTSLSNLSTV